MVNGLVCTALSCSTGALWNCFIQHSASFTPAHFFSTFKCFLSTIHTATNASQSKFKFSILPKDTWAHILEEAGIEPSNSQLEELLYLLSHYCYIYMKKFYAYNKSVKSSCFQTYSFYFEYFWSNWSVRFKPCGLIENLQLTESWQNWPSLLSLLSVSQRRLSSHRC